MPKGTPHETLNVLMTLCRKMLGSGHAMRLYVFLGAVLEMIGVVVGIAGPYVLKLLVDALGAERQIPVLFLLVGLFVFSWSGTSILSTLRSVYSTKVIDRMTADLSALAVRHQLPVSARQRSGDSGNLHGLLERLPYSLMVVVEGLTWRAVPIVLQLLGSLWLICTVIPIHYAAILALVLVGYFGATWASAKDHRQRSKETNLAIGEVSAQTADLLRNSRRVVLNGALDREIWRLEDYFQKRTYTNSRMMWSLVRMVSWQYGIVGIGLFALLSLGAMDVLGHHMTIGAFILLQAYAFRLAVPLSGVGFVLSQSAVAVSNIKDVLALGEGPEETAEAGKPPEGTARIQLKNISFSYTEDRKALDNISIDLEPGSFTVIVGPNGSGKSTLAQIMAGVLDPDEGQVLIDGRDLTHIPQKDRHRFVLYVPQFVGMLNRSLLDNGLYPPTTFTEQELAALLRKWNFHDDGRAPDLNGSIGEQGERLSGGQLQKLELARIAGVNVSAIILDESTSALDPAIEAAVVTYLRARIGQNSTMVMITHRIEMARASTQVIFLTGGQVVATGRHSDLVIDVPEYVSLWV